MFSISPIIRKLVTPTPSSVPSSAKSSKILPASPIRFFDAFCDYTSISGFRFLHSRYPLWFRTLSGFVLFGTIALFCHHSSVYVRRFIDKRDSIQMFTTKMRSIATPFIIICPLRQMKWSILYYEEDGPPDFIHIVSRFYDTSNVLPGNFPVVDGISVYNSTLKALRMAKNFSEIVRKGTIGKVLEGAKQFTGEPMMRKLFPGCTLLMELDKLRRFAQNRHSVYIKFANFREWTSQSADPELRKDITLMELARCRAETVVEQLEKVRRKMDTFSGYVRRAQPPIGDVVLFCRWLDGDKCTVGYVPSELGIDCIRIGGVNHIQASYATLRNNIDVVIDLNAFDNKLATWQERELQVLLSEHNESSICTTVDGFI